MSYSFWKRFAVLFVIFGALGWVFELCLQYFSMLASGHFFWVYPGSPASATLPEVFFLWAPTSLLAVAGYRWARTQPAYLAAKPAQRFAAAASVLGVSATITEFTLAKTLHFAIGSPYWVYLDSPIPETAPFMLPIWAVLCLIMVGMYLDAKERVFPTLGI